MQPGDTLTQRDMAFRPQDEDGPGLKKTPIESSRRLSILSKENITCFRAPVS